MSSGRYSSFRLPTALADTIRSTPSSLNAKILARKLSSDGRIRWPTPWRARKATRLPRSVPITYGPDGSPKGVVICCSSRSVTSAMSYRPLPPMMPIVGFMSPVVAPTAFARFGPDRASCCAASPPELPDPPDLPDLPGLFQLDQNAAGRGGMDECYQGMFGAGPRCLVYQPHAA